MPDSGGSTRAKKCLLLKNNDNVAMALEQLEPNDVVALDDRKVTIMETIEFGHKFAVRKIKVGEMIMKHGEVIGRASRDISEGTHVHVHNVESLRGKRRQA
jgi:altronate dehydratase small subunit